MSERGIRAEAVRFAWRRALHGFIRHRGIDSAATLSFFAALVVFPASLSIVSVFALFDDRQRATTDILKIVDSVAPQATVSTIREPLAQLLTLPNPGYALVLGLVLTIWAMSGYLTAVGRVINTAYEVQEGRQWFLLRGAMILTSILIMAALAAVIILLMGTPSVAELVGKQLGLPVWVAIAWDVLKWPVLAALAILMVAILYYYSPNVRHLRIRWVTSGALLAIIAWAIATTGFGIYVVNVSHYNKIYGWLGGAIILLLWLFLSNYVVVFGAEVDAEIVRVRQLEAGIAAEEVIQLPLRSTYRNLKIAAHQATDVQRGKQLREDAEERSHRRQHQQD